MSRRRPRMTPMDELLGVRPAAAADPTRLAAVERYRGLLDEAREAMVQPDPLRGYVIAESVQVTTALLIRADAVRP